MKYVRKKNFDNDVELQLEAVKENPLAVASLFEPYEMVIEYVRQNHEDIFNALFEEGTEEGANERRDAYLFGTKIGTCSEYEYDDEYINFFDFESNQNHIILDKRVGSLIFCIDTGLLEATDDSGLVFKKFKLAFMFYV